MSRRQTDLRVEQSALSWWLYSTKLNMWPFYFCTYKIYWCSLFLNYKIIFFNIPVKDITYCNIFLLHFYFYVFIYFTWWLVHVFCLKYSLEYVDKIGWKNLVLEWGKVNYCRVCALLVAVSDTSVETTVLLDVFNNEKGCHTPFFCVDFFAMFK